MNNEQQLLQQKLKDLPFSEGLGNILQGQQLETLQDLLNIEAYNWQKTFPGFTYHHQYEIVGYLQKNNLMKYLKEI